MTAENDFSSLHQAWYQSPEGQGALNSAFHLTKKALAPWHRRGHCILQMGFDHGKSLELLWQNGFDVSAVCSSQALLDTLEAPLRQCVDIEYRAPASFDHLSYADKSFDYVIVALPPTHADAPYPPLENILREALRIAAKGVLFQSWNISSLVGMQYTWRKSALPPYLQACTWHTWRTVYKTLRSLHPQQSGIHASTLRTFSSLWGPMPLWKRQKTAWEYLEEKGFSALFKRPKVALPLPLGALCYVRLTLKDKGLMANMPLYVKPLTQEALRPASVTERTSKQTPKPLLKSQSASHQEFNKE